MSFDWQKNFDLLLDWIWPRNCEICGKEGDWCCQVCSEKILQKKVIQVCPDCRKVSSQGKLCSKCCSKWEIDGLVIATQGNRDLEQLITSYKYNDLYRLDNILADLYIHQIQDLKLKFDVVSFVPLAKSRLWWRGYNQSELIAIILARKLHRELGHLLVRNKFTRPQVGLDKKDRLDNVRDVFAAGKEIKNCINKRVLLVDDVCTTMATLNECALVLKNNGALEVTGMVMARGI